MTEPAILADRLTRRFGSLTAVSGLTLRVEPGEVVGFLGPNGAGKTTTIRMLLGFLRPSAGGCRVLGRVPGHDVAVRRRIGYLPGDLRVDPAMTGAELLAWYGRLRGGMSRTRVDELVDRLGADPSRPFGTLSKGNRQKIGLVQAFAHDPDVLILDEPTTGLDPLVQRRFRDLVRAEADRGAAVLLSSHVLPEVERVASRLAIIRSGRLVSVAPVDDLLDRTRRRLELRFADRVGPDLFDGVPGVVAAESDGRTVTIAVDGPLTAVLRAAVGGPDVLRVGPAGDDLEDLFVSLYDGSGDRNANVEVG